MLRYVALTLPCGLAGMEAARHAGQPALYGLLAGLVVASGASSLIFLAWMRRFLRDLSAVARPIAEGYLKPSTEPGPAPAP